MKNDSPAPSGGVSRRAFLAGAGAAIGSAALAACGSKSSTNANSGAATATTTKPRYGGVLKVAAIGGSTSDTLNPFGPITTVDFARSYNLYESLWQYDDNAGIVPVLATGASHNKDATEWTIELRRGVTFHNGKTMTADDVIYSLQKILDPKNPQEGAGLLGPINAKRMQKVDPYTVRLYYDAPFALVEEVFPNGFYGIVPPEWTPHNPIGTGPFKYHSFTPGLESVFLKNPNYWQTGLPYIDRYDVINYNDIDAQVNALLSGEVQMANSLEAQQAQQVASSSTAQVYKTSSGSWIGFELNAKTFPFRDVNMRQAAKLLVDREQMLSLLFHGEGGSVAYDTYSPYDPTTDRHLPKVERDVEKVKYLMKKAGYNGEQFPLTSYAVGPATDLMSQVFAEQANQVGMRVRVNQVSVTTGYANLNKYQMQPDYWFYFPYLLQAASTVITGAPYNENHVSNPRYDALYKAAITSVDVAKRRDYITQMQLIDQDSGGTLVPIYPPIIGGASKKLAGVTTAKTGIDFGNWDIKKVWFAS